LSPAIEISAQIVDPAYDVNLRLVTRLESRSQLNQPYLVRAIGMLLRGTVNTVISVQNVASRHYHPSTGDALVGPFGCSVKMLVIYSEHGLFDSQSMWATGLAGVYPWYVIPLRPTECPQVQLP
jgi:hypothetical protein